MNTSKLFVGNLPYTTTEEQLRELFSPCGDITSLMVMKDKFTGRAKGFAFVEMATMEGAEAAIQKLHDFEINGRKMIVNEARPREERPRGDRPSYGDRPSFRR
ncbi:MAG: RNA-binding protein [Candidatus Gracilibacteria bacterium]